MCLILQLKSGKKFKFNVFKLTKSSDVQTSVFDIKDQKFHRYEASDKWFDLWIGQEEINSAGAYGLRYESDFLNAKAESKPYNIT